MRSPDRLSISVLLVASAMALAAGAIIITARMACAHTGEFHEWFNAQKIPDGTGRSCCAESDGHVLEEDDWRVGASGEYEVRAGSEWIVFRNTGEGNPGNTVLGFTNNPTGHPVAWYSASMHVPYCFAPGTTT